MKKNLSLSTLLILFLFATNTKAQENTLTLVKVFERTDDLLLEDYHMKTPMFSIDDYESCYQEAGKEPICEGENKIMLYDEDLNLHKSIYMENLIPEANSFETLEDDALGDKRFRVTQTLFNDDDLIEVIVKGEGFFAIVNENGKLLFKDEVNINYVDFFVKKVGKKTYLHVQSENEARLYLINKDSSNNIAENTITKIGVYPNPAREYVNVPYDLQGATKGSITISNLQGQELIRASVINNKETLRIPTDKLSSGLYIVTVSNEAKILSSEKVLVK